MDTTQSQLAALQAQVRQYAGQLAALQSTVANIPSPVSVKVPTWNWLATPLVVSSNARGSNPAAQSATQYTNSQIGSSAVALLVQVFSGVLGNGTGTSSDGRIYGGPSATNQTTWLFADHTGGVDTDTEGNICSTVCPCSGSSFWWSTSSNLSFWDIQITGWFG